MRCKYCCPTNRRPHARQQENERQYGRQIAHDIGCQSLTLDSPVTLRRLLPQCWTVAQRQQGRSPNPGQVVGLIPRTAAFYRNLTALGVVYACFQHLAGAPRGSTTTDEWLRVGARESCLSHGRTDIIPGSAAFHMRCNDGTWR